MFFGFIKKHKTKTLLAGAGFLVLAGLAGLLVWFYFSFLVSRDPFLDAAPAEVKIYWHCRGDGDDLTWLEALSKKILADEAAERAEFLFHEVASISPEVSFAVLPGFEDFVFWSRLDFSEFNKLKARLEEKDFSYIFEQDGKITVANSKFALRELLAVRSEKNFSLSDGKARLASFARANRRAAAQIYFSDSFKHGDFDGFFWKSDFWSKNILTIEGKGDQPENLSDFYFFFNGDNDFVAKNIENILRDDLAVLLPEKRDRILPDKTVVKEIVANPDIFEFEKREMAGREINYLSVPPLEQEFFVGQVKNSTLVANSKGLLSAYLVKLKPEQTYYGKNLIDLVRVWLKWVTPDFPGVIFGVNVDKV